MQNENYKDVQVLYKGEVFTSRTNIACEKDLLKIDFVPTGNTINSRYEYYAWEVLSMHGAECFKSISWSEPIYLTGKMKLHHLGKDSLQDPFEFVADLTFVRGVLIEKDFHVTDIFSKNSTLNKQVSERDFEEYLYLHGKEFKKRI